MEFYGRKGNNHYLISKTFNECFIFDDYGKLINDKGCLSDCTSCEEVDILSVISNDFGKSCEILFKNEYKKVKGKSLTYVIRELTKNYRYKGTTFRVTHSDGTISINQVLLVFEKDKLEKSNIDSITSSYGDWLRM